MTVTATPKVLPPGHDEIWPLTSRAEFNAEPASVPSARAFATYFLCEWVVADPGIEIGRTIVSELVTNAVQACLRRGITEPVSVRLRSNFDSLVVEVEDRAPGMPHLSGHEQPDQIGGHGLVLVGALAERWGFYWHDGDRKVVWVIFRR